MDMVTIVALMCYSLLYTDRDAYQQCHQDIMAKERFCENANLEQCIQFINLEKNFEGLEKRVRDLTEIDGE